MFFKRRPRAGSAKTEAPTSENLAASATYVPAASPAGSSCAVPPGMLESIADHLVQYDREWRYVFITERGAALLGKTPAELLGRSIWDVFPGAVGNLYHQIVHEAAATGEVRRFEHFYEPFNRWFENHVYPGPQGVAVFATDITQRKATELAVRDVERRHHALLDLLPVGVYWSDAQGILQYYNRRAAELWGREPQLGTTDARYCGSLRIFSTDGQHIPHDQCPFAEVLRTGEPVRSKEAMFERPDGTRVAALVDINPIRDPGGKLIGAVNVFQDITGQHRETHAQARLAAIVNSSHDAIIGKTLDGVITSWNAAAERLFGFSAAEIVGQHIERIYPPDRIAEEAQLLARIRAGESVENFETVRQHRDGQPLDVSVTISPVRDASGAIVGASSAAHDIRARKVGERALRHSESRYRSLVEASGAIVFQSDHESRWTGLNPGWEAYTGQPFEKYQGYGWIEALHPEDRERMVASVGRAHVTGLAWADSARLWHAPSGTWRWQEARAVPIRGPDGAVREWVGTALDVHQRRQAEETVQEADRRKDEFLAVLAHELRNPLAPIVSGIQIMRMPGSEPMRAGALDIMERQIRHMVRLVDDLMEVSRITRGTIELRRETLAIQDVVRAATEISRQIIDTHAHQLDVELPQAPLPVFGDRVRLTQIVANLLNNAAKYTPRGGCIRVSAERQGATAVICVADNGLGVPAHMLERIFEMFTQADRSTERLGGGLGIGLSLARRLAQLHGGTVEVASSGEGCGSEFSVQIPLAVEALAHAPGAQDSVQAADQPTRRILVVDDNRDAAKLLAALLKTMGHEVNVYHDGREAIRAASKARPEVMLLDIGMPSMDGYEVARRVRAEQWGAGIRLVAVTGWGQEADRHRSREAGFDAHLVKPVDVQQLEAAMR